MRWSDEQDRILREFGSKGAKYCRDLIHKRFGVYRSVEATQRHASRIRASVFRYEICPECGRAAKALNRYTGVCEVCNFDRLWREQVEAEQRIIESLRKGEYDDAIQQARRRYDAQRQRVSRMRRKGGYGDYVHLSDGASNRRSDERKEGERPPEKEVCAWAWSAAGACHKTRRF